ncbi:MAG: nitrous oxide-stimulated promoter family protein [Treponema sp.]|nr:nitrous oxide-stimulated promoter family protein [Treponema sp.]
MDNCRVSTYALGRLSACRYGESKTGCRACPTHCHRPPERERMRAVMRYSGPRMLLRSPLDFLLHDRRNRRRKTPHGA